MMDSNQTTKATSKNQLKRQKKQERWLEGRPERRKLEREKRKLKRKADAKARDEGLNIGPQKRYTLMENSDNKFKIVIDLDFEDFMTDHELSKSVQQVARIYAANRHAPQPCQLYLASLKGKCLSRFSIMNRGYLNWDINHSDQDYIQVFHNPELTDAQIKDQFIYLTADTDETLPDVDELINDYQSKIFIIGGLVDHNRHKNLCLKRAQERGIKTAKLPITEHVKLNQRLILSTVHVFEILLEVFGSHKTWSEALASKIPKRKIAIEDTSEHLIDDHQESQSQA